VEKDLANISKALSNATFARFVKDPCISRKDKKASMDKAVAGADETTRKLAGPYVYVCVRGGGVARVQNLPLSTSVSLYKQMYFLPMGIILDYPQKLSPLAKKGDNCTEGKRRGCGKEGGRG
jgi:hypothetical protein